MNLFEILILSVAAGGFLAITLILFYTKRSAQVSQSYDSKERLLDERKSQIHKLETEVHQLKADLKEKDKQLNENIEKLNLSQKKFQDEQDRVRQEDKEKRAAEEENIDRIWSEHEQKSLEFMQEVCHKKDIGLSSYTNKNPPRDFPKKIKPDFMVKVIDQYVVFDPKFSKNKNINTYIKNQVKDTASKYKQHNKIISSSIFFIIPTISIGEIKETYLSHEAFHFYVITVEAFEPIMRTLKRLTEYEFAKKLDPEDREKIVYSIALLSRHIREQNSVNLLGTTHGLKTLKELQDLPKDMLKEALAAEANISFENFSLKKMKELRESTEEQKKMLIDFIEPQKPAIDMKDIAKTEKNLQENRGD